MNPTIGFIGIGTMGHGMSKNLLSKGYNVVAKANKVDT
jgi:3-hydroxyisobutyrate dehydrogenase-like beta-hydroxyacid dehydrogenase